MNAGRFLAGLGLACAAALAFVAAGLVALVEWPPSPLVALIATVATLVGVAGVIVALAVFEGPQGGGQS